MSPNSCPDPRDFVSQKAMYSAPMALVNKTIRMTDAEWDWIAREARAHGVSTSDYVRMAGVVRASIDYARRDPHGAGKLAEAYPAAAQAIADYLAATDYAGAS